MARAVHEIRLDLSGVDLAALAKETDLRREARRLLPAALEELGQTMAEAAWDRRQMAGEVPPVEARGAADEKRRFVVDAGRKYKRHAPADEREALEDLIVRQLWAAKCRAAAGPEDGDLTVPLS